MYFDEFKHQLPDIDPAETEDWLIVPQSNQAGPKPTRRKGSSGPALKHFPKLAANPEPASGSPGAAPG